MASAERAAAARQVRIKQEWCKGCGICASFCPKEALSLSPQGKIVLDEAKCSGCGVCELFCPDFALVVFEEEGARECRK